MAKEKRKTRRVNVRVLDREKIMRASGIRVAVKGGKVFTFRVSKPLLNGRGQLILEDESGSPIMVTSLHKLARDVEEYFKRQGMEALYIYPAFQFTLE